jgi:hypothetical protein
MAQLGWQSLGKRTHFLNTIPDRIDGFLSVIDAEVFHETLGDEQSTHFGTLVDQELVQFSQFGFVVIRELDDGRFAILQ